MIEIKNLNFIYNENTPFEKKALDNINLNIGRREFIGLIGHTGSGKSTLVQHLNGLIMPTSGDIIVDGINIVESGVKLNDIRQKVGLVFQYPEYQLFEETIYKDIAFGPKNLNLSDEEVDRRVKDAMRKVGLDFEEYKDRSPFRLSGGQKRRVAIAGVLAMEPKVLVLDEPTAGLDPKGREEILSEIYNLYLNSDISVVLVSHSMEDIAKLVERILVMKDGKLVMDGKTRDVFKEAIKLKEIGLGVPEITEFMMKYKSMGNDVREDILTVEEAKTEMIRYLRGNANA
ncbi:MAG TPA: energy-coupling factor transporter ATPase [Tissierellaceae bacterium]